MENGKGKDIDLGDCTTKGNHKKRFITLFNNYRDNVYNKDKVQTINCYNSDLSNGCTFLNNVTWTGDTEWEHVVQLHNFLLLLKITKFQCSKIDFVKNIQ